VRDRPAGVAIGVAERPTRWENEPVEPDELYRELFCEIYDCSPAELGFQIATATSEASPRLLAHLALARATGPATAISFAAQLDTLRVIDRRLGAPTALCQVRAIGSSIEEVLIHSLTSSVRESLAAVLADTASLAGWQTLDLGDLEQSWKWHELAKSAAREAGDTARLAHATGQQSCLLMDLGLASDAVQLARSASERGRGRVPAVLETWLAATEAEACAAAGDHYGMHRALDLASSALPTGDATKELPYVALDDAHLSRWRGSTLTRIGDQEATTELLDAVEIMDGTFVRAWAGMECDLAAAFLVRGERVEARAHAQSARMLAKQTGSVRQRRRVEALGLVA
jgi:hypothetical protein